ncbi:MAG: metallophosphatase [Verrucomicrobia bacterium]|nr:MAG: metallophosphatase [Verrucomicrobiota bacterium]
MRVLIHLSDLHFGRADPAIVQPLIDFIRTTKPNLVAVSGDLTQRARSQQFLEARKFLEAIPFPKIVVPGNHDVPLRNLFARLFRKFDRFRRYISDDLEPFYADDEIAVAGVNTARALTGKNGRISRQQLEKLRTRFANMPSHVKIVVTHHPFDLPPGVVGDRVVLRAESAMKTLAQIPVDMLLAGHFHDNFSALIVASGTAISTRGRGQPNSLNVIDIEALNISITQHRWDPNRAGFEPFSTERFVRMANGWTPA